MNAHERLVTAIAETARSVGDARDVLRAINEPKWQDDFGALLDETAALRRAHHPVPTPDVANDYANLAGLFRQTRFAEDDKDRDRFRALRGARGSLLEDIREVLDSARALGLRPAQPEQPLPDTAMLETAGREGQLISLNSRITAVETMLTERLLPEATAGNPPPQQVTIVQHYVQDMRRYATSIKLSISVGDGIDLAVIERAASAMGRATVALIDTVRAQASKASEGLRATVKLIGEPVRKVVRGVGVLVRLVIRSDRKEEKPALPSPLPEDYRRQAKKMIFAGKSPPAHWAPHLKTLNLGNYKLENIRPLTGLTALTRLRFKVAKYCDLTPLNSLTALQILNLRGAEISDVTPLTSLIALQSLNLRGTKVSDLLPLARLTMLKTLSLSETLLTDLAPLARLRALRNLVLNDTQVSDLSPLFGLTALQSLSLIRTQVSDIAPLSCLTALQNLWLVDTQISDIGLLSDLPELTIWVEDGVRVAALSATLRPGSAVKVVVPEWLRPDRQWEEDDDPQA